MLDESVQIINVKDLPVGVIEFDKLLCGCGEPDKCWKLLYEYLQKADKNKYINTENTYELFFIYVINNELEFTEHGSSIYGSWLTDKGKEVLNWLNININITQNMIIDYSEDKKPGH
jgi:hypothetical protein